MRKVGLQKPETLAHLADSLYVLVIELAASAGLSHLFGGCLIHAESGYRACQSGVRYKSGNVPPRSAGKVTPSWRLISSVICITAREF